MLFTKRIIFLVIALFSFVVIGGGLFVFGSSSFFTFFQGSEVSLQEYADTVFEKCSFEDHSLSCYDREIPKLMSTLSMEEAFLVTRLVQEKDPRYLECHVLGHYLAERETAKDPSRWKDVVASCPVTMCNNGCPHGALMARFGNQTEFLSDEQIEEIKPDLVTVCEPRGEWNPAEVERSMCYHAIGHLNMYVTNANIDKSVEICKDIGVKQDGRSYVQTCTEGVLMSIYQPLGPEDFALVKDITPKKEEVVSFCSKYTGMAFAACHKESWPLFQAEIVQPEGLVKFCSYAKDSFSETNCYASLMNILTLFFVINEDNLNKLEQFCTGLPEEKVGLCFAHAARRLMQIDPVYYPDKAAEVCATAKMVGVGGECYDKLAEYAAWSFHSGSKEFIQYCNTLPSPWNIHCLNETAF